MFEWISSLALVIFEVICCVMFFESFCKEQENWKKWHKYALIGIQTAEFFACGMFLSQWIIIKQIVGVLMIVINMCVYFGISIPKSGILSVLYTSLVWGADYPGDVRTVDVHIRRLREKIEANPSEPKYVHTKWGMGYYYKG